MKERTYTVGTFYNPESRSGKRVTAYLRDYNVQWQGCKEYKVFAVSGHNAKIAAIQMRKHDEGLIRDAVEGDL